MAKHTPGPWAISHGCLPGDSGFSIGSDNAASKNVKITAECWPCTITSEDHRQELFANAKLIAAAPCLLEALISLQVFIGQTSVQGVYVDECYGAGKVLEAARAAIAKATST